jgi:alpha-L-fucosidase
MFEKDLPGRNTAGWNTTEIGALPLETCETIASSWGFNITDRGYKSTRDLIRYLVSAAGNDANFLLNVGPMPDGRIQPEFVERLKGVGAWLERHGESIYGTRGGPVSPRPWGVTTRKDNRIYVHLLEWPAADDLWLPLTQKVTAVRLIDTGQVIRFRQNGRGLLLEGLPPLSTGEADQVVVLETP